MIQIKCKLIKEIFKNEINGYNISIVKIIDSDDINLKQNKIYVVGVFETLNQRLSYSMEGEFVEHPKYGRQFQVASYMVALPDKKEELVEFLSSDMFPIGVKTAEKIVDKFGENSIDIILKDMNKLKQIPRLSDKKIISIHDNLEKYKESSKIILDLKELGFTTREANEIFMQYENKALEVINNNIYKLIDDLEFNFWDIDAIAINNQVELDDDNRIKALIINIFNELTFASGATYLKFDEIYHEIKKYVDINSDNIGFILNRMQIENKIKIEADKYYLTRFYQAEKYIAKRLCYLNDLKKSNFPKLESKVIELEKKNKITYDKMQKKAIIDSLNNNITIITGGPGTGKTTIIKAIVSLLKTIYKAREEEIALLAPTGKAARKMSETTLLKAKTIHKYLNWDKESNTFSKDEYDPNLENYIIIDEASMIDTLLMEALLKGTKRDIKLILVGDYHQLPSVSQGQVLKDIIDSEMLDVVKLNLLYRQDEESYIPLLAEEVKNRELSANFYLKKGDYNFIECSSSSLRCVLSSIVTKAIEKGYTDTDIQILAPMYKTLNGIDNLNSDMHEIFNSKKDKREVIFGDVVYRINDKILQLINDSDYNVSNGDIGRIIDIVDSKYTESKQTEIVINFDGNIVEYTKDKLTNIRHAYAISVHKSQGNEFDLVIIPILKEFGRMLYNKLIYTAITRAKKSLIIIGSKEVFYKAINNNYVDNRNTTLKDFIIKNYIEN